MLRAAAAQGAEIFDVRRVASEYQTVYEEVIDRQNGGRTLNATHQPATI